MSKAFTRESDLPEEDLEVEPQVPGGAKNYITPAGHARRTPTISTGRSVCARSSAASAS